MTTDTAALVRQMREALQQTLLFCETFSNRWDGHTGAHPFGMVERARRALVASDQWLANQPTNQCGEACERAKLCAVCARGLEEEK